MTVLAEDNLGSLADPEVQRCPFPFLKRLLAEAPVYRDPQTGMYIVTRFDDIGAVCNDTELFSNRTSVIFDRSNSPIADKVKARFAEKGFPEVGTLSAEDPPVHTQQRALVDKVFTPSYVRGLEPYIESLADELIDRFIERGESNLLTDFSIPLPMYIIADQLGVERSDYDRFKIWSDATTERNFPLLDPDRELELVDQLIDMQNYLYDRAQTYRDAPADNLLSRLIHAEIKGEELPAPEMINMLHHILVAGNETTTTGITTAMYLLLRQPELKDRLLAQPDLISSFVEEALRAHAPVPHLYRLATRDTVLGGCHIPKGGLLQLSYMAGNYDPQRWDEPECVQLARPGVRSHLSFGRGIHFCLGNQLARSEMRIAISKLINRLEELQFSPDHSEPEFTAHFQIHALDHLHVRFKPGAKIG